MTIAYIIRGEEKNIAEVGSLFLIRKFQPQDFEKVIDIEREAFNEYNPLLYMTAYETFPDGFLIAEKDTRVIGFVVGISTSIDEIRILSLAVDRGYQSRGIATALLKELIEIFRSKGFLSIKLEVRVSNLRAQKLYMSLGFNPVKVVPSYYNDGEDAYVMAKLLI